jgi:hypothetical protein
MTPRQWLIGTLNNNNYRVFNFNTGDDAFTIRFDNDNVGIGTPFPTAKLEVNGQIKITGGGPATGRVLISDANGLASWGEDNPKKAFSAFSFATSATIASGIETKLLFDNASFNDGAYYDPATSNFNVLSEGMYHFDLKLIWNNFSAKRRSDCGHSNRWSNSGTISSHHHSRFGYKKSGNFS